MLPIKSGMRTKMELNHVYYMCNLQTIREWIPLSLTLRAIIFFHTFQEIEISATLFQKTYKHCGIKFMPILRCKKEIDLGNQYNFILFQVLLDTLKYHSPQECDSVDEAIYTFNNFSTRA